MQTVMTDLFIFITYFSTALAFAVIGYCTGREAQFKKLTKKYKRMLRRAEADRDFYRHLASSLSYENFKLEGELEHGKN